MDLPSDLPGSGARRQVAIERCKPCANPHDSSDMPKYLPAGLTQYILNIFSKTPPPYHVTQGDVSAPLQRLEVEKITGPGTRWRHRGAVQDALGGTLRTIMGAGNRPAPLPISYFALLGQRSGPTPPPNRLYRRMRIDADQRELSENNGERFLAPGYACVLRAELLHCYHGTVLPKGAHVWYKGDDGLWWL